MDCNFCGELIPRGTEYIHVTSKGKALYFCSSKCLKNLVKLNRKPRETKWTQAYKAEKEARLKLLGQKPGSAPEAAKEHKSEHAHKADATEHKAKADHAHTAPVTHKEAKPKEAGKPKGHASEHAAKTGSKKPKK